MPQQSQRVADQGVHEISAGLLIVPGDPWFARVGVVVRGALHRRDLVGAGNLADHRADRGDELGDGVLGGDRVVQHGGVQCPPVLALKDPGGFHHLAHGLKDPVRPHRARQTAAEVGQQRRIEGQIVQTEPAGGLPPQVTAQFLDGLEVRQPVQGLHRDRRGQDLRRHGRPSVRRGIHVREHLRREQRSAMLGQEREHTSRRNQLPAGLPHIRPDRLPGPFPHHHENESGPTTHTAGPEPKIFMTLLGRVVK